MNEVALVESVVTPTLDQCIRLWLDAKFGKSKSEKTRKAYEDTLLSFKSELENVGVDLAGLPLPPQSKQVDIAPLAQIFASHSQNKDGVTSSTYNQRLAILSSFYKYAKMMNVLTSNPIERVEKRKRVIEHAARPLRVENVQKGLTQIDRSTLKGKRDYAILAVLLETGRRVNEVALLTYGNIQKAGDCAEIIFKKCKGGKQMVDTIPAKTTKALFEYLYALHGKDLYTLSKDTPVWVSFSNRCSGQAISLQTIQRICDKYLGTSKAHATRHTWAVQMDKRGAPLRTIQKGLGHESIATTSHYMDDLKGYENPYAEDLEAVYGIM
jgi:site-specific recombinase XerD